MVENILDREINNAINNMLFMDFLRPYMCHKMLRGIPLKNNEKFILIKRIDDDCLFDGYSLIRKQDVTKYRLHDGENDFTVKLQKKLNLYIDHCECPQINSWELFFRDISCFVPLVTLYRQFKKEKEAYVGEIKKVTHNRITLKPISPIAEWEDEQTLYFSPYSFCRIDYGDRYSKMLLKMQAGNE